MRSLLLAVGLCGAFACDAPTPRAPAGSTQGVGAPSGSGPKRSVVADDDALGTTQLGATRDGPDRVRVLVRFTRAADRAAAERFIGEAGAHITYRYRLLPDVIAVRALPSAAVAALAALPGVVAVVPDQVRRANLAQSRAVMHTTPAELTGFSDGSGVRVCVLDSGINQTHPAFAGAVVAQHDFVNGDAIAQDDNGHGSNVAGIVASRDATLGGVAPGASLVVGKVLAADGGGFDADIIAAIEWCTFEVAADIVNMSLGGGSYLGACDFDPLAAAVNASVDAGVVHVAAAGNQGNSNALNAPACASRAIVVGAVYDSARANQSWCLNGSCSKSCFDTAIVADKLACFSNRALKVDVVAPGSEITSADGTGSAFSGKSGTSQATPHVAGLIARLLGQRPELRPNHVRAWVSNNALDLGSAGFDVGFGHGRVDALATLEDTTAVICVDALACADGDSCTIDTCVDGSCAHRAACEDGDAGTSDSCSAGTCTHAAVSADDGRACTGDTLDACVGPRHTTSDGGCHPSCASAVALPIGVTVDGTTVGSTNTLSSTCPGIGMPGPNVVYRMYLRPEQAVTITLTTSSAWDPALYLVLGTSASACDTTRCVAGMDVNAAALGETLGRVRVPVAGYYFLIVDSFASGTTGTFTLTTTAACDPEDSGLPCDDGNECTAGDSCTGTLCVGGPRVPTCVDADCDDGDDCNGVEQCADGACAAGTPLVCDDGNPCTSDGCSGGCTYTAKADGTRCLDADVCNGVERCIGGTCRDGSALTCNDHNPCTADACDPVGGCVPSPLADGSVCSDSNACTIDDACRAGVCSATINTCEAMQLLFAPQVAQQLGGLTVADEDLVRYDPKTGSYALYFDGSDVGLVNTTISNVAFLANGDLILSFTSNLNLPGLGGGPAGTAVETRDLVRFTPITLGATTTGVFTFYFDGSDVGLTLSAEMLDAVAVLADGSIVVSTAGTASVVGVVAEAQDLMRFVPGSLGAQTSGSWSLYFDGSDVGLTLSSENVDGLSVLGDGALLVSTTGGFAVTGVSGGGEDVLRFLPTRLGGTTMGSFALDFDGSASGVSADVNALELRLLPL